MSSTLNIALIGNPNVGKSVIFHKLTGIYVEVSNYPGTTIEIAKAKAKDFDHVTIIDTPGVYGISDLNDEEKITKNFLAQADLIINVASSITLSRDLFLTKQLCDLAKPMLLVVNQIDEANLRKIKIKSDLLAKELGIRIIETVATSGFGIDLIKQAIERPEQNFKIANCSKTIYKISTKYEANNLTHFETLLEAESKEQNEIYKIRRNEINELIPKIITKTKFSKRIFLGHLLMHPFWGSCLALLILYLFLFQFLGLFVAGTLVDILETKFFEPYYEVWIENLISKIFPVLHNNLSNLVLERPLAAIGTILAGDYGILTLTIKYLYALLLPLVIGFYFGLALLEDSGYLPRLAVLADAILSRLGMNGRAIIPLILGGGCVTMAVITTRLLRSPKEKLITMALLGLSIPCSAQLGVIQGLLSKVSISAWLIWIGILFGVFVLFGLILDKAIPGSCGHFVSDIPPLRLPNWSNVCHKTFLRSKIFMNEASPAFFLAAASVAFLQVSGLLSLVINWMKPLVSGLLLLPQEITVSFILGMIRRDFGAFGLLEIPMSTSQIITASIVLTLFVPCIATFAVMIKEKNLKSALTIWLGSWVLAFIVGGIIARIL